MRMDGLKLEWGKGGGLGVDTRKTNRRPPLPLHPLGGRLPTDAMTSPAACRLRGDTAGLRRGGRLAAKELTDSFASREGLG
jgi:hypothetical protein